MERTILNLHAHSKYSDGNSTVETMAQVYRDNGYSCAVITDHDYMFDRYKVGPWGEVCEYEDRNFGIQKALEKWEQQKAEAKLVSEKLNYPVILGMELSLWFEEAVVFGDDFIKAWLGGDRYTAKRTVDFATDEKQAEFEALSCWKTNYAGVVVHPGFVGPDYMYKMFQGYEAVNHGHNFNNLEKAKKYWKNPIAYKGADAHHAGFLEQIVMEKKEELCVNVYPFEISFKTEQDIINFIRSQARE